MKRRRVQQPLALAQRLAQEATNLRLQARGMPRGVRRDELLRKARQAESSARVTERVRSPRPRLPE